MPEVEFGSEEIEDREEQGRVYDIVLDDPAGGKGERKGDFRTEAFRKDPGKGPSFAGDRVGRHVRYVRHETSEHECGPVGRNNEHGRGHNRQHGHRRSNGAGIHDHPNERKEKESHDVRHPECGWRMFADHEEKESESGYSFQRMRETAVGNKPSEHPEEWCEDGIVGNGTVTVAIRNESGSEHGAERTERD